MARNPGTEWAQDLAARLQSQRGLILAAISRDPSQRTGHVARRVARWALQRFPEAHASGRNIRGPIGPVSFSRDGPLAPQFGLPRHGRKVLHEFMFDLVVFRRGHLRPLLAGEFEWSKMRFPRQRPFRDDRLSLFIPSDELQEMDAAQRDRAHDFMKVFVCCPEIGVFGGYLNPSYGGRVTVDHLVDQDKALLRLLLNAHPLTPFPMVYVAIVRTAREQGFDFGVRVIVPSDGDVAELPPASMA